MDITNIVTFSSPHLRCPCSCPCPSYQTFIVQEAKHKHHQVNPLVDQRLRQAYRRVQLQAVPLGSGAGAEQDPPVSPIHRTKSSSLPSVATGPGKSLDVSFKTSLVETYQRLSYTGTGTAGTESVKEKESWEEWLRERQSVSTAGAQSGVVDDILRLVPGSISSETENCLAADTCLYDLAGGLSAFGAFSVSARRQQYNETVPTGPRDSVCVCTADVLALVNDVLDSHLCCRGPSDSSSTASDVMTMLHSSDSHSYASRLQSLSHDVYTLADDLAWQCISGSSDILTVLAATSFCLVTQEVTVSVRVINSAMFKVPTFSLQVCLQSLEAGSESEDVRRSGNGQAASFLHTSLPTVQEGVDYFIPGEKWWCCLLSSVSTCVFLLTKISPSSNCAIVSLTLHPLPPPFPYYPPSGALVDRQFTFTMHKFRQVAAVVRVIYPDLVVDLKAVEVFETVPFLPAAATTTTTSSNSSSSDKDAFGGGGDESGETARKSTHKESDVANVAHIDCIPIRIPLGKCLSFCIPYSHSATACCCALYVAPLHLVLMSVFLPSRRLTCGVLFLVFQRGYWSLTALAVCPP